MKCTDKEEARKRLGYTEREWARIMEQEKQEKKRNRKLAAVLTGMLVLVACMGFLVYYLVFRSHDYTLNFTYNSADSVLGLGTILDGFEAEEGAAADLCVVTGDTNTSAVSLDAYSAALFDLNDEETVYAKDVFTRRSPASITKIMTCLVALKYGNLDDQVTVTSTILNIEEGSSVADLKVGDVLSLKQLLYGMMVVSGNDAAMMVAEHIAGSVDAFVDLMNEEALAIGATDTHFTNPHGLTDSDHYTTVYDIYLIFNEAMQYDTFMDIINRENYYAEYTDADGNDVAVTWDSTNQYFTGDETAPDDVVVYGGKTGTTNDAGYCLGLLSKELYGKPYSAVILHADSKESLYGAMNSLL
ncbi:MAG: serine hydrolase, partial [Lachnospiraceae bacterium]|nr:serine hydrolase [Lachnospiraceae bacterium]